MAALFRARPTSAILCPVINDQKTGEYLDHAPATHRPPCPCLFLLPSPPPTPTIPPPLRAAVDKAIRPLMAEHDVPGMAVAVTVDGQACSSTTAWPRNEQQCAGDENTLFELGSISKTFTATLAGYAQEQGKLSLDDHPGKYLPQLKDSAIDRPACCIWAPIRRRPAAAMPDEVENSTADGAISATGSRTPRPARSAAIRTPASACSATSWRSHEQRFSDAVECQLFPQLGLKHSYIHVPPAAMVDYAWGYNSANKPVRVNPAYSMRKPTASSRAPPT
jgi:beta-lactamase class C